MRFGGEMVTYTMVCPTCGIMAITDPWFDGWVFYLLEHITNNTHRRAPWNLVTY